MHLNYINYEQQYQIRGPDGTVLWSGTAIVGIPYRVYNSGATVVAGCAMIADGSTTVLGRFDNPAASDPIVNVLAASTVVSATSTPFLGVAIEPIATLKLGLVAGVGSLCMVICTSGAIAVGASIGGSATSGMCAAMAAAGATAAVTGYTLGTCIKANAQQGALGVYAAGVLVNPK